MSSKACRITDKEGKRTVGVVASSLENLKTKGESDNLLSNKLRFELITYYYLQLKKNSIL